jgi:hypothetical protein
MFPGHDEDGLLILSRYTGPGISLDFGCEVDDMPWDASDGCAIRTTIHAGRSQTGYGTFGYRLADVPEGSMALTNYSVTFTDPTGISTTVRAGSVGSVVSSVLVIRETSGDEILVEPSAVFRSFIVPIPAGSTSEWILQLADGRTVRQTIWPNHSGGVVPAR